MTNSQTPTGGFPIGFIPTATPHNERFFAIFKPTTGGVALCFDRGMIELTLAESEALAGCLNGANQIARGQHPAQSSDNAGAET